MNYQHEARGADKAITDAIDKHVDDERGRSARARLMARRPVRAAERQTASVRNLLPTWPFFVRADDGNRTRTVSLGS
jgi:hypothetical protein